MEILKEEAFMEMQEVKSSNISSIGWDAQSGLVVKFSTGKSYQYASVPFHVFSDLQEAPSKGQYFAANIKGRYEGIKL
jgi:hypothetical protein